MQRVTVQWEVTCEMCKMRSAFVLPLQTKFFFVQFHKNTGRFEVFVAAKIWILVFLIMTQ